MKDFHFFFREFFLAKYKNSSQNEYHVSNCVPNSLIFGSFACLGIVADRGLIYLKVSSKHMRLYIHFAIN